MGPAGVNEGWEAKTSMKVRAHIITAKVRFELPREYFESSTLSNTISPDKAEDLAWSRGGETVELERIGGVSVGDCGFQIRRKINDCNGLKGASRKHSSSEPHRKTGTARTF